MSDTVSVILENEQFRLTLSESGTAQSLVLKETGTECLYTDEALPFFTLTEERPYNNEIKLAHPTKRTTFAANRVRSEGDRLIVGFEHIDFEAVVKVTMAPQYLVFTLEDFIVKPDSFGLGVIPIQPPVSEFRLVQLPLIPRAHFGEWLNVTWDDQVAVNVLSTCPYPRVSAEKRRNCHILFGETLQEVQLLNAGVAIIVSRTDRLLDAIDALEQDFDLPRGVQSRRSPAINRSYCWVEDIDPLNVEEHIARSRQGGFRYMAIYYGAFLRDMGAYLNIGDYHDYRDTYPNGKADLALVLQKLRTAGIQPGLHVLPTHIGMRSRYLTPKADHRLNLKRQFTLAKPASATDTTLFVEENPALSPTYEKTRVLRFMGELIHYESYTTERPYRFLGCTRGYNDTVPRELEEGTIGGVLDLSEFCANSAYVDQRNSLQDEIAEAIAEIYNTGFTFLYLDGAEGVNPPFDVNVGLAQWRIYRRLNNPPLFCEGAAKSHFSWHILSGGNAFDPWAPHEFKQRIVAHPVQAVPRMADDFTRLNFGWWMYDEGQRADIFEYGAALAAAWNCPISYRQTLTLPPRGDDILEIFRRWEDVRTNGLMTEEWRKELRHTEREHTLLINENGQYELAVWEPLATRSNDAVTVFLLERTGKVCAVVWHNTGEGQLSLPLKADSFSYVDSLGGSSLPVTENGDASVVPVAHKRYLITELTKEELREALSRAVLV